MCGAFSNEHKIGSLIQCQIKKVIVSHFDMCLLHAGNT